MIRALAAALIAWALPAVAQPSTLPCATTDKPCLAKVLKGHRVRTAAFWKEAFARPVAERIGAAPPELVDYVLVDNLLNGFPNKPRASVLDEAFLADARGAMEDLPPAVRRLLGENFAGVWFLDDLGGSGYTEAIRSFWGRSVGGYIVLDAGVLRNLSANEWATWKENTPFRPDPAWRLEARIEEPARNDRRAAIRYILLHELGHVLSIGRNLHPPWDMLPYDAADSGPYPFYDLSWRALRLKNIHESRFEKELRRRDAIVYYLGARLDAADMARAYADLGKTNFPTLYAATSPGDDFAESFVSYVHTVLMRRPWEIVLRKDGKVAMTYRTCWEEPRCATKRRLLEGLLR